LNDPIQVGLPQLLDPEELALPDSGISPAYLDEFELMWLTDGVSSEGFDNGYPGGVYRGLSLFNTSHLTIFGTIQEIPPPDQYSNDTLPIEIWWFVLLIFAIIMLTFILVILPKMWHEYNKALEAKDQYFPDPELMETFGKQGAYEPGWAVEGGGEGEGGDEDYDEDDEYYEDEYDEDYDEDEE
jgi:hypothetical protein